ncbi:MAG TPA: DUF3820 family protein [Chlamydiales bacterium]|nr:DUF3820 family protein [Chlamydiales bacterium]
MKNLSETEFVCIDCETTGLDPKNDHIIEIAIVRFNLDNNLTSFDSLVDPKRLIPSESQAIHHISNEMIQGKPLIKEILPQIYEITKGAPIIGHGIDFDIKMMQEESYRNGLNFPIEKNPVIDTLRLARLYGESPVNSLEQLRKHFNIEEEGAHRALADVIVNISVFKHLTKQFTSLSQLLQRLEKPILIKTMPLGKHKGRPFSEIPIEYLRWAAGKEFDQDLLYSIRKELNNRKKQQNFFHASNPFSNL